MNPFQGANNIHHAHIAGVLVLGTGLRAKREKTKGVKAMVNRHHYHVIAPCQVAAVIVLVSATAQIESATMQPHHHRSLAFVFDAGGPQIKHQAVFTQGLI